MEFIRTLQKAGFGRLMQKIAEDHADAGGGHHSNLRLPSLSIASAHGALCRTTPGEGAFGFFLAGIL